MLYVILLNVFVAPWGMASTTGPVAVGLAIPAILVKACLLGCAIEAPKVPYRSKNSREFER